MYFKKYLRKFDHTWIAESIIDTEELISENYLFNNSASNALLS